MGDYHKEISIEKGLRRIVKHGRVSKKKTGGRTEDDMTVVTVRGMRMGPAIAGSLVVYSSNVGQDFVLGGDWSKGARDRIETRLRDFDGGRKGRTLFGVLEDVQGQPTVACVLCYHIERAGHIIVKSIDIARDLETHKALLFEQMFRCCDHIACEHSKGSRSELEVEVPKDRAPWFKETLHLREVRKSSHASKRILGRTTVGCRAKSKRERAYAQQSARE